MSKQKLSGADALEMRDVIKRLREEKSDLLAALESAKELIVAYGGREAFDLPVFKDIQTAIAKAKG